MTEAVKETHLTPKGKRIHWCEAILQEKENVRQYWASCDTYSDVCDGVDLLDNKEKCYWESMNDNEQVDLEWEELSFNDWVRIKFGRIRKMTKDRILKDHWTERFGDVEDIDDNDEPKSYDGFIDLDNEAYNERKCRLLGLTYREPPPILIEKVKVTRYSIGPKDIYTKVKVLGIDRMSRTRDNVATIRAGLMEEMGAEGGSRSKEMEFEVKSTRIHVVKMFLSGCNYFSYAITDIAMTLFSDFTGYEFSQDMLVKSSALAIIIWSIEQRLGESLVLILLLSLNFISLNVQ
ncbi:hypothetical protein Tco_0608383 [Tanacetum coccineum]